MKIPYILLPILLLTGCAVSTGSSSLGQRSGSSSSLPQPLAQIVEEQNQELKALTAMEQVVVGMNVSEVRQLMGDHVTVGFKFYEDKGSYEAIQIPAPYKEEEINETGQRYKVLYYLTHIEREDGRVTDDELTPLVFQAGNLLAIGWDAYFQYKIPL